MTDAGVFPEVERLRLRLVFAYRRITDIASKIHGRGEAVNDMKDGDRSDIAFSLVECHVTLDRIEKTLDVAWRDLVGDVPEGDGNGQGLSRRGL